MVEVHVVGGEESDGFEHWEGEQIYKPTEKFQRATKEIPSMLRTGHDVQRLRIASQH